MASPADDSRDNLLPPRFENLEERLLLTTLVEGDDFIYYSSQEQTVRISLTDNSNDNITAACEILTYYWHDDGQGNISLELSDLPGFYLASLSPLANWTNGYEVPWSDGKDVLDPGDPNDPTLVWQEYSDAPFERSAQADIFAIYFSVATSGTILTISALENSSLDEESFDPYDLDIWGGDLPIIVYDDTTAIEAPESSGGVLVGALPRLHLQWRQDPEYLAVSSDAPRYVSGVWGVFPGGDLRPGITIAGNGFVEYDDVGSDNLGTDTGGLAGDSAGGMYSVDSSPFAPWMVGSGGFRGNSLGSSVSGLAADDSGLLYAANNGRNVDFFANLGSGGMFTSLAADGEGGFYTIRLDNYLRRTDLTGLTVDIGRVVDALSPTVFYENITGLDFNPVNGMIYGAGNMTGSSTGAMYLLTIDPNTAHVLDKVPLDSSVVGLGTIAFTNDGTEMLYAVDRVNSTTHILLRIDIETGLATTIGALGDTVLGMDFVGSTLYGLAYGDPSVPTGGQLYVIDPATAATIAIGNADVYDPMELAYDASNPGVLFTVGEFKAFDGPTTPEIGRVPLGSTIVTSNSDGNTSWLSHLYDASDASIVYTNVDSLAFDRDGKLWGMAKKLDVDPYDASDTSNYLIRIDPASGKVMEAILPSMPLTFTALAFDASNTLYGLATGLLVTIDLPSGTVTLGANTGLSLTGMDFVDGTLYGATFSRLYAIKPDTGVWTQLADTGRLDMSSLTGDPSKSGMLWSTGKDSNNNYRALRIPLSSTLMSVNAAGMATDIGLLLDSTNDGWAYKDFHALDYDSSDDLYGIATVVDVRPYDGASPTAGAYLLKIDTNTAKATQVARLTDVADLVSIAFDQDDNIYGITPSNELAILNVNAVAGTATTTVVGTFTVNIDAIEFTGPMDTLYGVDSGADPSTWAKLYRINPSTAVCSFVWEITNPTGDVTISGTWPPTPLYKASAEGVTVVSGLTADPLDENRLLVTATGSYNNPEGLRTVYYLSEFVTDPALRYSDMGTIAIAGTLAGALYTDGSVERLRLGFLYGNVYIGHNLGDLISEQGGGAVKTEDWGTGDSEFRDLIAPYNYSTGISSMVFVGGTARMIDFRGLVGELDTNFVWTGVEVSNDPNAPAPSQIIYEIETAIDTWEEEEYETAWLAGYATQYDNNQKEYAQFLSHPTGEFWIRGTLGAIGINTDIADTPYGVQDEVLASYPGGTDDAPLDWYAISLMAGQTIWIENELDLWSQIRLYDFDENYMDSWGYESEQDEGQFSRGTTLEPMVFTAPAAGIYYMLVVNAYTGAVHGSDYSIHVYNGPDYALGGVNVIGSYDPNGTYGNVGTTEFQDASIANVSAKRGGGIGAVMVWHHLISTRVQSLGNGDLSAVYAGIVGGRHDGTEVSSYPAHILSDGNIGMVSAYNDIDPALEGWLEASVVAGYNGGVYNHDAHIQNIFTAADCDPIMFSATGSIGTIETIGSLFDGGAITANSDYDLARAMAGEPAGKIDLVRVHLNLGGQISRDIEQGKVLVYSPVTFHTNPGGDVGYINVDGDIRTFSQYGSWSLQPASSRNGEVLTLWDDSGGKITITPHEQYILDAAGNFVLDPVTQQWQTWYPSVDVYQVGVNDMIQGGVGGAIARIRSDGPITVETDGEVQIGQWDVSWGWAEFNPGSPLPGRPTDLNINFRGSGNTHIYYLHDDSVDNYNYASVTLSDADSAGSVHLTSGYLSTTRIGTMHIGGNLGAIDHYSTGAWIFGHNDAPVTSDDATEPQYGWFHNKIQGLQVDAADITETVAEFGSTSNYFRRAIGVLEIGGSLRDLRVTGTIGRVVVNSDRQTNFTEWDSWDGVEGIVWSETRIDSINVGDGLADDGSAVVAEAGIFSGASIGSVYIDRSYYEMTAPVDADINEQLRHRHFYNNVASYNRRYGMLDGAVIGYSSGLIYEEDGLGRIVTTGGGTSATVLVQQRVDAITLVRGTNGAKTSALILGRPLWSWHTFDTRSGVYSGGIGTVEFMGPGAEITGAEVAGWFVNRVATSVDSAGIIYSHINTLNVVQDRQFAINEVIAGGLGMYYSTIDASGGVRGIGTVKTNGASADFVGNVFLSSVGLDYLGARDMIDNGMDVTGKIHRIKVARDFKSNAPGRNNYYRLYSGIRAGAIGYMTVGRNFQDNWLGVAGELTSLRVYGDFLDTQLDMYGSTRSYLKSLVVTGDITGQINVQGRIGSIVSKTGTIYADITTVPHSVDSDVGLIEAAGGIWGNLDIAGSVKKIISRASLGQNPAAYGKTQLFNIWGDLDNLRVIGTRTTPSHLYADINVGGDIGTIDVDGTLYSNIRTNGNFKRLILDGGLGGDLGGAVGNRGSLTVFGNLNYMKFDTNSDLVANLSLGGSVNRIMLRNSDLIGNVESRYGSINNIVVNGGSVQGNLTAKAIGTVRVTGGSITGDVTATDGGVKNVSVTNGNLDADLTASNGKINLLKIVNGSATAGHTITASAGIKRLMIHKGDLDADVISGGGIDLLQVTGSDVTGLVSAAGDIKRVNIAGTLSSTVRSGGRIINFQAGSLNGAIVSAAWDITRVNIKGNVVGSKILAGYDVGPDGAIGGADDNVANGGNVHSANIKVLNIVGVFDGSVVAAGVDRGSDGKYYDTADNVHADGVSSITRMQIRGGYANTGTSAIVADTSIFAKTAAAAATAGVTVASGVDASQDPAKTGTEFGKGTVQGTSITVGALKITLNGPGTAWYDAAGGNIALFGTTTRTSLILKNTGAAVTINVSSADDSGLGALRAIGVTLGNVSVDGEVRTLNVETVADTGVTWSLPGGVRNARIKSDLTNVTVRTGYLNNWRIVGAYNSGTFKATGLRNYRVEGVMGADFTSYLSDAYTLIFRGNLDGDVTSRGMVRVLDVIGDLTGRVTVNTGDLLTVKVGGNLSGAVNVQQGMTRNVIVRTGDFGGTPDTSFRAAGGIMTFNVARGDFSGLLSSAGDIRNIRAPRGEFSGRAWSGGSVRNVVFYSMNQGLLSASGDVLATNIKTDMAGSWIFAGFDPGDAGYHPVNGETDNLTIDAFQASPAIAGNADQAYGGTIKRVTIGGDMGRLYRTAWGTYTYAGSTISAGVAPGKDGYVGTDDDQISGTGYVNVVRVVGGIYGSGSSSESYGIYAANNMPTVYHHRRQRFVANYNCKVDSMYSAAGNLAVTDVYLATNAITVTFSHALNPETIDENSFTLIASVDDDFTTAGDNTNISTDVANTIYYSTSQYTFTVTLLLSGNHTWGTIGTGLNLQLTIDGATTADSRGNLLDGEFIGAFPSGNGVAGGDFVWTTVGQDMADEFADALTQTALTLTVDGGTTLRGNIFESAMDVDIYRFSASAYEFLATQYIGDSAARTGLFFRDTQGTAATDDDTFELVARWEESVLEYENIFQAVELPETGEYFLAVASWSGKVADSGSYTVGLTLSSTDQKLVADLGGALPADEEIAYVSNAIGDNNNLLGAQNPKQLVYLNFDGGVATEYFEETNRNFLVAPFSMANVDLSVVGSEDLMIDGGTAAGGQTVTGILDNFVSIHQNTPASHPDGQLTVAGLDLTVAADWATYQAASEGLFVTTIDPALRGLDPETDFTTVFVGSVMDGGYFGNLLGIASSIDLANMSKADNALVFEDGFSIYRPFLSAMTEADKLNAYSRVFANIAAHELGHILGLNHQPTDWVNFWLQSDDPDNNPATLNDSNTGVGVMAYADTIHDYSVLMEYGTARLTTPEFPVGHIDTADLLLRWLS